jgi:3-oxoacyl-[acyl-carrier protein] reductase
VSDGRGTVLLTGVGRRRSIGAGLALGLAKDGWDLAINYWAPYHERVDYGRGEHDAEAIADECRALGRRVDLYPGDLASLEEPARLVQAAAERHDLAGLVMSHCESVDSSILDTTVDSWERHFAVNARATWLLVKAFAERVGASTQCPTGYTGQAPCCIQVGNPCQFSDQCCDGGRSNQHFFDCKRDGVRHLRDPFVWEDH